MSKRNLRRGTRKDYSKMLSGVDEDLEVSDGEQQPCFSGTINSTRDGDHQNKNKSDDDHSNGDGDGEIINRELVLTDDNDGASSESSDNDEVVEARRKLKEIKKEQQRLSKKSKKSKLDRINREVVDAQKALNKLRKQNVGRKGGKKLTSNSLRDMEEVRVGVDRLMDKSLSFGRRKRLEEESVSEFENSSAFSSSTSSHSSSSSSSESDADRRSRKKKSHRRKKGKSCGKKKSGKSKRLTSYVKFPQKWPHSALSLHFVNKEKKYEELSISEFCAGYATILEVCSDRTRAHRTAHLKELMYLATKYQWRCVLNYHAAVLLEIERGHLRWGDSFRILQNTTLAGGFLHQKLSGSVGSARANGGSSMNSGPSSGKDEGTLFCRGYQRGTCKQARDHYGWFNGENRLLKHICAKCWLTSRSVANHPETDDSCPNKDEH